MARSDNVPISGPMLQEEACLIAAKWGIMTLKHQMAGLRALKNATTSDSLSVEKWGMFQRRLLRVGLSECKVLWRAINLKTSGMRIKQAASTEHYPRRHLLNERKCAKEAKELE